MCVCVCVCVGVCVCVCERERERERERDRRKEWERNMAGKAIEAYPFRKAKRFVSRKISVDLPGYWDELHALLSTLSIWGCK